MHQRQILRVSIHFSDQSSIAFILAPEIAFDWYVDFDNLVEAGVGGEAAADLACGAGVAAGLFYVDADTVLPERGWWVVWSWLRRSEASWLEFAGDREGGRAWSASLLCDLGHGILSYR